ncbi:YraN family protein [Candidatus Dojkabacteria bacterium]|uniref:UPF0102 protein KC717_00460 n=1 Tax=Candidatus Dojkabacteria bacterium TaxID=2099670 RepID=A0A955L705_9BACT|nr:YraN family protein [Candidatus Dojkabacteria bacterium]
MKDERKRKGKMGQDKAQKYLEEKGLVLVDQNFTIWGGELDLIFMQEVGQENEKEVIFVEVKTRTNNLVDVAELLSYSQLKTLLRTAEAWLMKNALYDIDWRIDLVGVLSHKGGKYEIEWIQDIVV